ncbi:MAG: hypothetical protein IIC89_06530 [Chloroflexi bacterium]|nr:hypothetical protein [Chloroflexota bacterium]
MSRRIPTSPLGRPHNFGPADEDPDQSVFGACRPGFPANQVSMEEVDAWTGFMATEHVRRVVCLLASSAEFKSYRRLPGGLLGEYERRFGSGQVLHAQRHTHANAIADSPPRAGSLGW